MKYIIIALTITPYYSLLSTAVTDENCRTTCTNAFVTPELGMKDIRRWEKTLNKVATLDINPYTRDICTKEVKGWL